MLDLLKSTEKKRRNKVYEYVVVKQRLESDELGAYDTYGIKLKGTEFIIDDVACDFSEINRIVDKLNKYQADPLNAFDIVQDMIAV